MPATAVVALVIFIICLIILLTVFIFPLLGIHLGRTICILGGKLIITVGGSILGPLVLGITEMGITSFCNSLPI